MACSECFRNDGRLHKPSCPRGGIVGRESDTAAVINWRDRSHKGYVIQMYNEKNPMDSYFDIDLITHITGNLWMGGVEDGVALDEDFVKVVSLYPREEYVLGPNTERVDYVVDDGPAGIPWKMLDEASDEVLEGMKRGKTLVHCQAGLNRSGAVAALVLMKLGWYAQDAIDFLRRTRCKFVLSNPTFVQQLHMLQHELEKEQSLVSE